MIRMAEVQERIRERVPGILRYGNAADYASIASSGQIPTTTPAAFVLFGGLLGGKADAASGMFRQNFSEAVTVMLMDRVAGDPLGDKTLRDVSPLVGAVVEAVCGWGPEDAPGVFQLILAELVGTTGGALVFQIDFTLNDQLRIQP